MIQQQELTINGSMPEVPDIGEGKCNSILVAAIDRINVPDAAPRLSNETNPTFTCFFHSIIPRCYHQKTQLYLGSEYVSKRAIDRCTIILPYFRLYTSFSMYFPV